MSTRSEAFRSQMERTGDRRAAPEVKESPFAGRRTHKAKKAIYSQEFGKPSRKSTRKSANRSRTNSQLERAKSPEFYPIRQSLR